MINRPVAKDQRNWQRGH